MWTKESQGAPKQKILQKSPVENVEPIIAIKRHVWLHLPLHWEEIKMTKISQIQYFCNEIKYQIYKDKEEISQFALFYIDQVSQTTFVVFVSVFPFQWK